MRWSDIDFQPETKKLRQFAALWLVVFGSLAVWKGWWQGNISIGAILAVLATTVGIAGLIFPARIRIVFVGATILAFPLGWLISHVLLALLFFGLLMPVGLAFRLAGRDPLLLKRPRGGESYWLPKPRPTNIRAYFNQF